MATTPFPSSNSPSGAGDGAPVQAAANAVPPAAAGTPASPGRPPNELLDRVVEGAHQAIDRLADSAAPHVQRLQQGVSDAGDAIHQRAGQARELGDEWAESLRCTVRENPLAAVATALVVGVLIAKLTQR